MSELLGDFINRRNASLSGCRVEIAGQGQKCKEGCAYQKESFFPNSAFPCKAVKELPSGTLLIPEPTVDNNGIADCGSFKPNLATSLRNLLVSIGQRLPILPL